MTDQATRQPKGRKRPATPMASDHPGNAPAALTVPGSTAVAEPIVLRNELWNPADPNAYNGGRPAEITHLAEYGATQEGRRDDARWSGILEVIPTKADYVLDLLRANSLWPLLSGLACCAIEMMSFATSKNDVDRFGAFPFRASPRQADVLIVAGTLTTKMAAPLLRLWEQMPEPKWCVAVYGPGCPPRPEGLIFGMMKLQQLIKDRRGHWPERAIGPTVPAGV